MTVRIDQRGLTRRAKLSVNDLSTGILTVSGGGTGVATLSGLVVGNGTSIMTGINTSTALASVMADETGSGALVFGTGPTLTTPLITSNMVMSKTSGEGIKLDIAAPAFGWRDILGQIGVKTASATEPAWAVYRGSIYAYTFDTATAEAFFVYHMPHDYVPGSDMHIHMHWSQNVVDTGGPAGVPGNVEWNFDISYADGHGTAGGAADPFIAPITVTVVQQASTTQYGHMIAEVQFTNAGGTGGLIDSNTIVVDGVLLVRAYRIKGNAADTLNQAPFGHTCDIHYQSTNMATKNKSPNFYT